MAVASACLLTGAAVAPAGAQNPLQSGYGTPGGNVQSQVGSQQPAGSGTSPATTVSPAVSTTPGTTHVAASTTTTTSSTPTATSNGSSLPFTGLDVGIVAALGLLLVGGGLALRLIPRRRNE